MRSRYLQVEDSLLIAVFEKATAKAKVKRRKDGGGKEENVVRQNLGLRTTGYCLL